MMEPNKPTDFIQEIAYHYLTEQETHQKIINFLEKPTPTNKNSNESFSGQ